MSHSIDPEGSEIRVLADLVDFSGADVLEVGCGDGRMTRRYADEVASALGLDPNPEKIRRARAATPASLRSRVSFVVADITTFALSSDAFDVAVLAHSL